MTQCAAFWIFLDAHGGAVTAIATVFIAAFTVVLAFVTRRQSIIAANARELAADEFIASHRPRLRVRNIVITNQDSWSERGHDYFPVGNAIAGQFYVSNVGGSDATIIETRFQFIWPPDGRLPMRRPYEGEDGNTSVLPLKLAPGESGNGMIPRGVGRDGENPDFHTVSGESGWRLYAMGWVIYEDGREVRRRTAFCRVFQNGRFVAVNDPDYDHEE